MSLYKSVQEQIQESYKNISDHYDVWLVENVLYPDRVIEVYIPVLMDDGSTKTFTWYRSQHNNIRGPYKGGIRFHQDVSKDEVMSLSAWMSLKTAVAGIPLWGGKWWIIVNPKDLSAWELERLSRWFIRKIYKNIWPDIDVPAPDVNTNGQIMSRMRDEYEHLTDTFAPWVITGKPLAVWWSAWRDTATAQWGLIVLKTYLEKKWKKLTGQTVAIQWAGNAWLTFARLVSDAWATVVAISDSQWWVYDKQWLDISAIETLKKDRQSVQEYTSWQTMTNEELLELDVDILVPAALESVITEKNADAIKAPLILELANWPVSTKADAILEKKKMIVIPDILANAGGVTVSYFEQVQNNQNYYRLADEVMDKLERIMKKATTDVLDRAEKYDITVRQWAYVLAVDRILEAHKLRG